MAATSFNSSRPTKIIVHGFIDNGFVQWIQDLSEALLDYGDFNVVAVDWGGGSGSLYSQSAANTRLVGLEIFPPSQLSHFVFTEPTSAG